MSGVSACPRVVLDLLGEPVRATVGDTDRLIGERAVVREGRDLFLEILVLGDFVGLPDDLLVVQCHAVLLIFICGSCRGGTRR